MWEPSLSVSRLCYDSHLSSASNNNDKSMKFNLKIHHLALLVSNLDRAKEFYGSVLGLQEMPRPKFHIPGAWYELGEYQRV